MIPLDLSDDTVLRRTLEELEAGIPVLSDSARPLTTLPSGSDLAHIELKVNELVVTINLLIDSLNRG